MLYYNYYNIFDYVYMLKVVDSDYQLVTLVLLGISDILYYYNINYNIIILHTCIWLCVHVKSGRWAFTD